MAKRKRRPADELVQYAFTVDGWDYYYEFGARGASRYEPAGLHHVVTLTLRGRTTFPEGRATHGWS